MDRIVFSRENIVLFLLVEEHQIAGKSLFGGSVACTFCPNRALGLILFARQCDYLLHAREILALLAVFALKMLA